VAAAGGAGGRGCRGGGGGKGPPPAASSRPTSGRSMSILLRLEEIEVGYGDMTAVQEASLEVREGETVALIGGNGAGKTTTQRAISGLLPLRRGRIEFAGERVDGLGSSQVVARGIAHVPEGRQLFPTLTVPGNPEGRARSPETRPRRGATPPPRLCELSARRWAGGEP